MMILAYGDVNRLTREVKPLRFDVVDPHLYNI